MAGSVVYTNLADDAGIEGCLFAGKQFWVAQRIPSRTRYLELIRNNGGKVILLDKKADYLIADHLRRDCPPGSISFRFIDESIRNGELADPREHPAGPPVGTPREAGSISRPGRPSKARYTAEEDRILYTWVRDHEKGRGSASGNEIYKQLEAKYPRHTWQSWRDHYLKQLRDRPPVGLNVPGNAPPSPPSDQSAEQTALIPAPSAQPLGDYSVQDLEKMFDVEDWEELYGNVQLILSSPVGEYNKSWENWAKGTYQTAEQWRQYFEKVVRPQWHTDTPRKQKGIKDKVARKHGRASSEQEKAQINEEEGIAGPSTPSKHVDHTANIIPEDSEEFDEVFKDIQVKRKGKDPSEAYMFWAREQKHKLWEEQPKLSYSMNVLRRFPSKSNLVTAELHLILKPKWDALSKEEQAPYLLIEAADRKRYDTEHGFPSESSTAAQETPEYIKRRHETQMKRIIELSDPGSGDGEQLHATKRRKSQKPLSSSNVQPTKLTAPRRQPIEIIEISSGQSSSLAQSSTEGPSSLKPTSQDNAVDKAVPGESQDHDSSEVDEEVGLPNRRMPTTEENDFDYPRLPSDSPSPQASRRKPVAFDTQAILSSPSQAFPIAPLPRPLLSPEPQSEIGSPRESPPSAKQESIASATHSIREFRRSLDQASAEESRPPAAPTQAFDPLPLPSRSSSLAPSETDSSGSGDPDPPLNPTEMDEFFEEQHENGFTDDEITDALRHTRCRPGLALQVLDAWKVGEELPVTRGIWATEDDENVEGGDAAALARLERIHTCDGWGGITERLRFLQNWRASL